MSEAPKNVFVKMTEGYESNWWGVVTHPYDEDGVEYVRADLVEAKLAKAMEALNTAANWIDYCAGMMPDPLAKATIRSWADQARTIAAELTGDNP
jgi:hypothetical protein